MVEICTQRDLNCLSDPDRNTRKRVLEKISKDVNAHVGKPDFTPDVVKSNLDLLHKPLLKCVKDPAEKCRELSVTILAALVPLVTAKDVEAIAGEVRPGPAACLHVRRRTQVARHRWHAVSDSRCLTAVRHGVSDSHLGPGTGWHPRAHRSAAARGGIRGGAPRTAPSDQGAALRPALLRTRTH